LFSKIKPARPYFHTLSCRAMTYELTERRLVGASVTQPLRTFIKFEMLLNIDIF
jgi:hypothetical protein